MTDRPILFQAPMVRALLAGTKTQTRRVFKPQPPEGARYSGIHYASYEPDSHFFNTPHGGFKVRRGIEEGDRLWVREAFSGPFTLSGCRPVFWAEEWWQSDRVPLWYWADGNPADGDWTKPKTGIHMPRWASRLTLTVTDVRVQRLQDISEEDARAEGVTPIVDHGVGNSNLHRIAFNQLWERIHGEGSTYANPWVSAISFTVEPRNIDAVSP